MKSKKKKETVAPQPTAKTPPPPPAKRPPPPPATKPEYVFKPVYVKDHANPRAPWRTDPEGIPFALPLPPKPVRATYIRYTREATDKDGPLVLEVPAGHYGDFSSFKTGKVEWGRVEQPGNVWIPITEQQGRQDIVDNKRAEHEEPELPGMPPAPKPPRVPRPAGTGPKKEGVCAFIDALIMEGTRTAEAIRDLTLEKFPGRDPVATMATVKTRPSHIKAKGLVPPPFVK